MAAPGATPIILYHSTTASAQPSTANLAVGELGVNVTDKKIYSKDGGGALITLVGTLGNQAANAVAITGGAINGTTIGASTASTGRFTDLTDTGLTSGRVTYASTGGNLVDSANLTFNGTTLSAAGFSGPIGAASASTGAFTTLSASGVATFSAGTVATPAITTTGDTNTGMFFPAADTIAFSEGGAEAMRINSSGNVGIGTSAPDVRLDVTGGNATVRGDGTNAYLSMLTTFTSGYVAYFGGTLSFDFTNALNGPVRFSTNNTVRMTVQASGGLSLGTSSDPGLGSIYATGNITAFFSDDRLKTRHGKIENALTMLRTLDGFYYTPNETAQNLGYEAKQDVGVSAQAVQAILPEVVAPAPIDDKYLTVRYEKLVPLLIEAIKELTDKVEKLESKYAT